MGKQYDSFEWKRRAGSIKSFKVFIRVNPNVCHYKNDTLEGLNNKIKILIGRS